MFEQSFKNFDDVLRREVGCPTDLDFTEQTSWILLVARHRRLEGRVSIGFTTAAVRDNSIMADYEEQSDA